ncbi:MAG: DUF1987 domain-containing protein [Lachnospiraceae bacterium]|nr:DUF1987 domain-containing protein [Lachnospiraceae bacterium]
MAFYLEKEKTGSTPKVLIDEAKKYMKIEGESYHENVIEFFKDISTWLEQHFEAVCDGFVFECEMTYFNSSTAKLLLNMLLHMDDCAALGKNVTVNWITSEDNDIIIECGEDFEEELSNLTFNLVIN